jgi:hypothetical protein
MKPNIFSSHTLRVLRRIFGPKRYEVKKVGENYIMRNFITCTFLQV